MLDVLKFLKSLYLNDPFINIFCLFDIEFDKLTRTSVCS